MSRQRKTTKKTPPKSRAAERTPIRREVGALACFLLSVFTLIGLFSPEAWFIRFTRAVLGGVIGRGFWLLPFALLAASVMLLFHRGRPVRLRLTCVLLMPLFASILLHLFFNDKTNWTVEELWAWKSLIGGEVIESGGVAGGLMAQALKSALTLPGATIVLILCILVDVCILFRINPVALYDDLKNRPRREYEREDAPKPIKRRKEEPLVNQGCKKRRLHDPDIVSIPFADSYTPADTSQAAESSAVAVQAPPEIPDSLPEVPFTITIEDSVEQDGTDEDTAPAYKPEALEASGTQIEKPYKYPPIDLLNPARQTKRADTAGEVLKHKDRLAESLENFSINGEIINHIRGPSVTRYDLKLGTGVRLSTLTSRSEDIALALGVIAVNIAPVAGKVNVVGIEVPNTTVSTVYIRELIESGNFQEATKATAFVLGRDISGSNIVCDITKLVHLLIAGTTGSGKSVCINSLIVSLLYKASPDELKFIMIDPKMVELGRYNGIPHLLTPVVNDPREAAEALEWAVVEMDNRFKKLMEYGKRDIDSYNQSIKGDPEGKPMPRIVVIIDEMADLMMVAGKEVETAIARVAQKARACGIHLILATQRPEAKVVTGIIKANIPSRIGLMVKSNINSRIILDESGAEKLVGYGDMLYLPYNAPRPLRVQGCFVDEPEVERVVSFLKENVGEAEYSEDIKAHMENATKMGKDLPDSGASPGGTPDTLSQEDDMLPSAIELTIEAGQASTSYLQRRLKLGFARAARLMDMMEERGIVGPNEGAKPRQVLYTPEQWAAVISIDQESL
ncbi:MAG: DNA translocase FtsK [Oscillospiraceae bacterium]|nr:DNA translocase FtsK [Oscillospiraceae bacterium]